MYHLIGSVAFLTRELALLGQALHGGAEKSGLLSEDSRTAGGETSAGPAFFVLIDILVISD